MPNPRAYLGDAVYAEADGWNIWLTTQDGPPGATETNRICLEPSVLSALFQFRNHVIQRLLNPPQDTVFSTPKGEPHG